MPAAYLVPASTYEQMMELMEDLELGNPIERRRLELREAVEIDISDL